MRIRIGTIALLAGALLLWTAALYTVDQVRADTVSPTPVCHSQYEDSVIYDCDYRNGAWYQR